MTRIALRAAAGAFILAVAGGTGASAQDLPDAKTLLNRYHEAINASAYRNITSMRSIGEFSMPAQGITASFDAAAARPGQSVAAVSIPGIGELRMGVYNGRGWTTSPFEGARLYTGAEQVQALDDAAFDSSLRPDSLVSAMSTVERTQLGGRDCYKVKVTWKSGRETFDCYDVNTGLLVGYMYRSETNAGSGDAVTILDEYREFGGVKMPTRIVTQTMGMEQVLVIREVKINEVEPAAFEPPAQIRTLLGG